MIAMGVGMVSLVLLVTVTVVSVREPSPTSRSRRVVARVSLHWSEELGLSVLYLTAIEKGMLAPWAILSVIVCLPGDIISLTSWSLIAPCVFSLNATGEPIGLPS